MPEVSAWRIDRAKYAATSFNGVGAAKAGGRWNSAGVRVVYASEHLSMAAMEKFVHLPRPIPPAMTFVQFAIDFSGVRVMRFPHVRLPGDWMSEPPGPWTPVIGDDWVRSGRTAILAVPSVLIPGETNFLLNPDHPDFRKIKISTPQPFTYDPRMANPGTP